MLGWIQPFFSLISPSMFNDSCESIQSVVIEYWSKRSKLGSQVSSKPFTQQPGTWKLGK